MVLVFYKLNSAIERGTKPYMLGCKPCHWTSTLKAAMVNARRAWKDARPLPVSTTACVSCAHTVRACSQLDTAASDYFASHQISSRMPSQKLMPLVAVPWPCTLSHQ